jgi:hypothetical protein
MKESRKGRAFNALYESVTHRILTTVVLRRTQAALQI